LEKGFTEKDFTVFLEEFESKTIPLQIEMAKARWLSQTTGRPEDLQRSSELNASYMKKMSDRDVFQKIVGFREAGDVKEPLAAQSG
jgi:hypothetical protein